MTTYTMRDEAGSTETVEVATLDEARSAAREWVRGGDYDTSEGTVRERVAISDADGDDVETLTVAIDPTEPDCAEDRTHEWRAPVAVVGGLSENPGVFGHGGGVIMHEVCRHCGTERVTDTWAQDPATGEQGLESVRYEHSTAAVEHYETRGREAADEADIGDDSWCEGEGALAVAAYRERMAERADSDAARYERG